MKWNKVLGIILIIIGIFTGIFGLFIIIREFSILRIFYTIFFWIVSFILMAYGIKAYRVKGKKGFRNAINNLIQDLASLPFLF